MINDLQRRIYEHKIGIKGGFAKKYGVNKLMYFEIFKNVEDAILREKRMKKWNRIWKIELIEKENVKWIDLSADWYDVIF